jgi:hypothetical protein
MLSFLVGPFNAPDADHRAYSAGACTLSGTLI